MSRRPVGVGGHLVRRIIEQHINMEASSSSSMQASSSSADASSSSMHASSSEPPAAGSDATTHDTRHFFTVQSLPSEREVTVYLSQCSDEALVGAVTISKAQKLSDVVPKLSELPGLQVRRQLAMMTCTTHIHF